MSGPKRNPDRLNTIGVVVVGICGAVLIYVSIAALQAFYMNDSAEIQTMADYGGNDTTAKSLRTAQIHNITDVGSNPADPKRPATYHIDVKDAMKLVTDAAKVDPANLVPTVGRSDKPTVQPIYGRPKPLPAEPTTPPAGADSGAGAGSAAPAPGAGSGSAAAPSAEGAKTAPAGAGTGGSHVGREGAGLPPSPTAKDVVQPAKTPAPGAHPATKTSGENSAPADKATGSAAKGNGK